MIFKRTSRRRAKPSSCLACLACGIVLSTGCFSSNSDDQPRVRVQGQVTIDGQPLPRGVLQLIPLAGVLGPKTVATIESGRFATSAHHPLAPGLHRIEIRLPEPIEYAFDNEQLISDLQSQRGKRLPQPKQLPARYNDQSTLTADLQPLPSDQPVQLSFQLTSR